MSEECLQLPAVYSHLHKSKTSSPVLMKPILRGKYLPLLRGDKRTGERQLKMQPQKLLSTYVGNLDFIGQYFRNAGVKMHLPCPCPEAECIATNTRTALTAMLALCIPLAVFLVKNNGVCTSQYFGIQNIVVMFCSPATVMSRAFAAVFFLLLRLKGRASSGGFLVVSEN